MTARESGEPQQPSSTRPTGPGRTRLDAPHTHLDVPQVIPRQPGADDAPDTTAPGPGPAGEPGAARHHADAASTSTS
ncbi:hypothetical protein ND747_28695, partial [Frankia sp. R82]